MFPENTCIHCGREIPKGFIPLCPESLLKFSCNSSVPKALGTWISLQKDRIAELTVGLPYPQRKIELLRRYSDASLVFNVRSRQYRIDLSDNVQTAHCFATEEQAFDAAFRLAGI